MTARNPTFRGVVNRKVADRLRGEIASGCRGVLDDDGLDDDGQDHGHGHHDDGQADTVW